MGENSTRKRRGLISNIIWLLNLLFAFFLLTSYLSSYINPESITVFAFFGLGYPALLLINALFLLFWLIRRKRRLFLSLIIILIGYQPFIKHIQLFSGKEAPASTVMKLLSYNVQNMAHSNIGIENADIRQDIYEFIQNENAEITCLQEFSAKGSDFEGTFKNLKERTGFSYCVHTNYYPHKTNRIDAMIILSKHPLLNTQSLSMTGGYHHFGIYSDIVFEKDTFRLYNLHLQSIRLQHEDYKFVEDVSKGQTESASFGEGSKSILKKLHNAYKMRARQTLIVVRSTPLSYAYHKISEGLNDAFVTAGQGLGNTFAGKLPPMRIDYIFFSDNFQSYEFIVHKKSLSDHFPISVYLGKADE